MPYIEQIGQTDLGRRVLRLTENFDKDHEERRRLLQYVVTTLSDGVVRRPLTAWVSGVYWREAVCGYLDYLVLLLEKLWSAYTIVVPGNESREEGIARVRAQWQASPSLRRAVGELQDALRDDAAKWFNVQFVCWLVSCAVLKRSEEMGEERYWPYARECPEILPSSVAHEQLTAFGHQAYGRAVDALQNRVVKAMDCVKRCGDHAWIFLFDRLQLHQIVVERRGGEGDLSIFADHEHDGRLFDAVNQSEWMEVQGGLFVPRPR